MIRKLHRNACVAAFNSTHPIFLTLTRPRRFSTTSTSPIDRPQKQNPSKFLSIDSAPTTHAELGPPKQIACYSRLSAFEYLYDDNTSLRRFVEPAIGSDLTRGQASFWKRKKADLLQIHQTMRLDTILEACTHAGVREGFLRADLVTTKKAMVGLLHGLGTFNVSYSNGKLYLEKYTGRARWKISTSGYPGKYGFERACSAPYLRSANTQAPHGLNDWYSVISRSLGGFHLLVAGEIACIKVPYTGRPDCYLELRCRKTGDPNLKIRKDLKDWYFHAHVMGTRGVFVGYRGMNNVLERTELVPTHHIPGTLLPEWDPTDSIRRVFRVLYVLREYCQEVIDQRELRNDRRTGITWQIELRGKSVGGFEIRELTQTEVDSLNGNEAENVADMPRRKRVGIIPAKSIRVLQKFDMF
ncbi:RAI1-domain-containingprotein [Moniliophthora roreri MCA 2997]|uniref:Decapping nuclease n=1 Tax=Moniliophthora roreri (strain MCA 2997) TaxID=1381753 RepID=V2WJG7_MONRO|nr:RAI1-domain-containingprotein [Moniliophthora roreri MCA 2997]